MLYWWSSWSSRDYRFPSSVTLITRKVTMMDRKVSHNTASFYRCEFQWTSCKNMRITSALQNKFIPFMANFLPEAILQIQKLIAAKNNEAIFHRGKHESSRHIHHRDAIWNLSLTCPDRLRGFCEVLDISTSFKLFGNLWQPRKFIEWRIWSTNEASKELRYKLCCQSVHLVESSSYKFSRSKFSNSFNIKKWQSSPSLDNQR